MAGGGGGGGRGVVCGVWCGGVWWCVVVCGGVWWCVVVCGGVVVWWCGGGVVVVWWWWCGRWYMTIVFIVQPIGVTEHLGVGLLASPPPEPSTTKNSSSSTTENGHSRPAGRSAKNAAKCGKIVPPEHLNILSMNWSEVPPGTVGNLSLRDHNDVHNRKSTAPAAPPQFSVVSEP